MTELLKKLEEARTIAQVEWVKNKENKNLEASLDHINDAIMDLSCTDSFDIFDEELKLEA